MLRQVLSDTELITFGDGAQTRDFIHATDVASAIWKAAQNPGRHLYNIGSGAGTSINDLIRGGLLNRSAVLFLPVLANAALVESLRSVFPACFG